MSAGSPGLVARDRTRDCLDPWRLAMLRADGTVALCCWGAPVDSLREQDLAELLRGPQAAERRARLLAGDLGEDCLRCPARGWTSPAALRDRLDQFLHLERERRGWHAHRANLEDELQRLRPHAATLERELVALRTHSATLERELSHLRPHARFVERERGELQRRTRLLEAELQRVRSPRGMLDTLAAKVISRLSRLTRGALRRPETEAAATQSRATAASAPPPRAMRACIESLRFDTSRIELSGWGFLPDLVFDELRLIVDGIDLGALQRSQRPDVAAAYPHLAAAGPCGFAGSLNCASPPHAALHELRVVGSRAGRACGELVLEVPRDPLALGPTPPEHLMRRVAHIVQPELFRLDGLRAATDVLRALARHRPGPTRQLLDWGVGCGRVLVGLRARLPQCRFAGADLDTEALAWCRSAYPDVELSTVGLDPPTCFSAERFDVILGLSVMTHLDRQRQRAWVGELRRLLAPGGTLLLSVHGPLAAEIVGLADVRAALAREGISDATEDATLDWVVSARDYRATFQTESWTRACWGDEFGIVEWINGGLGGFQDLVVLENPDAPAEVRRAGASSSQVAERR